MNKEIHKLLGRKRGSPGEPAQEPIAVDSLWNCTTTTTTDQGKEQKHRKKRASVLKERKAGNPQKANNQSEGYLKISTLR